MGADETKPYCYITAATEAWLETHDGISCARTTAVYAYDMEPRISGLVPLVRADLHEALRAERDALAARVERLEGALRELLSGDPESQDYWEAHERISRELAEKEPGAEAPG